MADAALVATGSGDAPLSYLVPGATAIQIKQIHVAYVDNGASGDWLPAVRIISDSKHRMGTAADQAVKVTAGSDADVSFFPGVKHSAAAASSSAFAYSRGWSDHLGHGDPALPTSGAGIRAAFANIDADPTGAIDWTTTVNPNDTARLHAQGLYLLMAGAQLSPANTGQEILIYTLSGDAQVPQLPSAELYVGATIDPLGVASHWTATFMRVPAATIDSVSLLLMSNGIVFGQFAYMAITYLGVI